MEVDDKKLALLIDADNISPNYMNIMLSEAKNYGTVSVRRIYGDWTSNGKNSWKSVMLDNSLTPIQQYSYTYGKNASDSAMIIDAMDILYAGHVDGFILASSDSDFTRLAMRLREAGKFVIGMGESKTPKPFVKSCDEFKVLDILFKNSISEDEETKLTVSTEAFKNAEQNGIDAPITDLATIKKSMLEIIDKHSDANGLILLSELGRLLTRLYSDFDARNYGKYRKFSDFVRNLPEFEITVENTVIYVKKSEVQRMQDTDKFNPRALNKKRAAIKTEKSDQTIKSDKNEKPDKADKPGNKKDTKKNTANRRNNKRNGRSSRRTKSTDKK